MDGEDAETLIEFEFDGENLKTRLIMAEENAGARPRAG
jgi:hypothetical protein